jgi:hypothetical protein
VTTGKRHRGKTVSIDKGGKMKRKRLMVKTVAIDKGGKIQRENTVDQR